MTLADDLARMEAEDNAATLGPWRIETVPEDDPMDPPYTAIVGPEWKDDSDYEHVVADNKRYYATGPKLADQVLFVSARTDRPALVEMVRELSQRCMDLSLTLARDVCGMGATLDEAWLDRVWAEAKKKTSGR